MKKDDDGGGTAPGRQPERPGQPARHQDAPGQRDPGTLDSRRPPEKGEAAAMPAQQAPRRGVSGHPPPPPVPDLERDGDAD
ncbi:MAG TPA: hypothetical protein VII13_04565 [Vicinamibacteria bacterium]|jgi:hypothetical protein